MQQHFNAPVETVFNSLSQHATFNTVLWPVRSVRIKDAAPPEALDGVGSTRKMGFGPIKPILETITKVKPCELIEYRMEANALISHHHGKLEFSGVNNSIRVTYTIELESRLPLLGRLVLTQLKWSATRGLEKLNQQLMAS